MSEVGGLENLLWEEDTTDSWAFWNSDNSGGGGEKISVTLPDSASNTQTPKGKEVMVTPPPPPGKRRSGGVIGKDGKGSAGHDDEVKEAKVVGGGESDHENHIWTERERRKRMRSMFTNLHKLLPHIPPKADKTTIVDEAVTYIKNLQQTLQKLQKLKLERLHGMTCTNNFNPSTLIISPQNLALDSREAHMADQVAASSNNSSITSSINALPFFPFPPLFLTWTSQNVVLNVCGEQALFCVCARKIPGVFKVICCVLEKHNLDVISAHVSSDQNGVMFMIQAQANIAPDQLPEAFPLEDIYKQAAMEIMLWVSNC